jgi:hypothetical protein
MISTGCRTKALSRSSTRAGGIGAVAEGREPAPTAGLIDSQSAKTTKAVGLRGYDVGKKIEGRKRHVVTDTLGKTPRGVVHGTDVKDHDGRLT